MATNKSKYKQTAMSVSAAARSRTWDKVLYKKQNVSDNYVDPTFLSDLRKNVNLYKYTLWEAILGVAVVTHEISSTILFVLTFVFLKYDILSITSVVAGTTLLIFICSLIQQFTSGQWWMLDKNEYAKSYIIFFGYIFSPILKTLTQSISTDTICAMVTFMMIVHVIFQDYGADAAIVSPTLSLNSALFGAVCLASRLPTVLHTFALMVLAVEVFVLVPMLRKKVKNNTTGLLLFTIIFFVIDLIALMNVSSNYALMFVSSCCIVNFVCPLLFVHCQKYKENIFGPWDEAVVKIED